MTSIPVLYAPEGQLENISVHSVKSAIAHALSRYSKSAEDPETCKAIVRHSIAIQQQLITENATRSQGIVKGILENRRPSRIVHLLHP